MSKPDAHLITTHLNNLKNEPWVIQSQAWWVDHLFHFTDITNAVEILKSGCLLSRTALEMAARLTKDIASPDVITDTSAKWKDYVRLYFRPRTPTQYRNEGFRPTNRQELGGAHCPVPIIFIFNSSPILMDTASRFSNGNLAADANVGETVDFLLSLPFEKIYHDGSLWGLDEGAKRTIIFHRHAEVIIPNKMDLKDLKFIWCRSQAEFETMIDLLPHKIYSKWAKKIGVGNKASLFFTKWSFITKADLSNSSVSLTFNPSLTPGPFHATLEITEQKTQDVFSWEDVDFYAKDKKTFSLSNLKHPEAYHVSFRMDGHLAYQNQFINESELPF